MEAVRSIQAQTFNDWELLIVDDGSTDGSQQLLQTINDARIKVTLLERNRGACFAMNTALAQSQGDFIAVLNSDDVARPHRFVAQLDFLTKNSNVLASFALPDFIDDDGRPSGAATNDVFFRAPSGGRAQWLRYFIDNTNCLCHPTLMARRGLYDKVGNYDNTLVQLPDFDLWVRALRHGDIAVQREILIDFRMLRGGRNASAPNIPALMRCQPELYWIARHFFSFDDGLLQEALSGTEVSDATLRHSPRLGLIEYLAAQNRPYSLMAALDAARDELKKDMTPSLREKFLVWTGSLDPFGLVARSHYVAPTPAPATSFASAFGRRY